MTVFLRRWRHGRIRFLPSANFPGCGISSEVPLPAEAVLQYPLQALYSPDGTGLTLFCSFFCVLFCANPLFMFEAHVRRMWAEGDRDFLDSCGYPRLENRRLSSHGTSCISAHLICTYFFVNTRIYTLLPLQHFRQKYIRDIPEDTAATPFTQGYYINSLVIV